MRRPSHHGSPKSGYRGSWGQMSAGALRPRHGSTESQGRETERVHPKEAAGLGPGGLRRSASYRTRALSGPLAASAADARTVSLRDSSAAPNRRTPISPVTIVRRREAARIRLRPVPCGSCRVLTIVADSYVSYVPSISPVCSGRARLNVRARGSMRVERAAGWPRITTCDLLPPVSLNALLLQITEAGGKTGHVTATIFFGEDSSEFRIQNL